MSSRRWNWIGGTSFVIVGLVSCWGYWFLPRVADNHLNAVRQRSPYAIPADVRSRFRKLPFVADLHGDPLLWQRDLLKRNTQGQIDIPRLIEAGVALQTFGLVTKSPKGQNKDRTDAKAFDNIGLISFLQWPRKTWSSLFERGLYQAHRLADIADMSWGRFRIIRSREELALYLRDRQKNRAMTAGLLAAEGAHLLEGKLSNLDRLYQAGLRMISTTHFFDNEVGGSAHGLVKGGLTPFGRKLIRRAEELKMIIDLAHVSQKSIDQILAMTKRPVVVSHTGVRGTCPNNRNLTDRHLRAIAKKGGLVGIGLWETAVCGKDARATARAMRYAAKLVGVEHVALGGDMDGAVTTPFDVTGLPLLMKALEDEGFTAQEIRMILGENYLRLLQRYLP